ncbi:hypothetical protein Tco_0912297 [Tanacetum coccineum]
MPKSIHVDHQDTAYYIPKYHKTKGLNDDEYAIYKNLERCYFHEGLFSSPLSLTTLKFASDSWNLLESFKFLVKVFSCFSSDWAISSLPNCIDSNLDIYLSPVEDPSIICDALFYERPLGKTPKVKGQAIVLDPFQIVLSELKLDFKKWETILSENIIRLIGKKDHPNACLSYVLYCLTIQKPFNLAYYIAKRIESVTKSDVMALPYGMLLTRLYEHVCTTHPYAISDLHHLVDHVMIPLTKGRALRIKLDEKRPHPQTPSESSRSPVRY